MIESRMTACVCLVCLIQAGGSAEKDRPFRVNRISDRVILFSPGKQAPSAVTSVITTEAGLILVDTGLSPSLAAMTRRRIKRELGRDIYWGSAEVIDSPR